MTVALTITIDRTGLSLSPLVLSGVDDDHDYGITAYQPPALQARVGYMPDSGDIDGSEAISSSWQQSLLGFSFVPDHADDETDVQASYAEVAAAVGQFSFTVTTQVSGAPAQVWSADRGSIALAAGSRSYLDLTAVPPVYSITIPVYPVPA